MEQYERPDVQIDLLTHQIGHSNLNFSSYHNIANCTRLTIRVSSSLIAYPKNYIKMTYSTCAVGMECSNIHTNSNNEHFRRSLFVGQGFWCHTVILGKAPQDDMKAQERQTEHEHAR
jgi:hypothetical protein